MPANVFSRTDTHAHTTASDSTVTPAQLMEEARDAGLTAIGLTDHDTISGWEEAAARVADSGVALLRGMEISARFEGITVHILGYLFDPSASALVQHIREVRDSRIERAKEIVRRLAVDFPISWDDVARILLMRWWNSELFHIARRRSLKSWPPNQVTTCLITYPR